MIDERPSSRYLIAERPGVRQDPTPAVREPALTPEELAAWFKENNPKKSA